MYFATYIAREERGLWSGKYFKFLANISPTCSIWSDAGHIQVLESTLGRIPMRYTSAIFTIPTLFAALASAFPTALRAQPPVASTEPLLEMKESVEQRLKPSSGQVAVARSEDAAAPSLTVTIQPGADDYPGIMLEPPMPWDLLAFGHVESRITNLAMAAPAAAAPAS